MTFSTSTPGQSQFPRHCSRFPHRCSCNQYWRIPTQRTDEVSAPTGCSAEWKLELVVPHCSSPGPRLPEVSAGGSHEKEEIVDIELLTHLFTGIPE